MAITSGWVTGFGSSPYTGNEIIVNGTTRKATTFVSDGRVAMPRIIKLGNGTKVNYDSSTAPVVETRVRQELIDSEAQTWSAAMRALLGTVGTLEVEHTPGGSGSLAVTETNSSAMLLSVTDTTRIDGAREKVWVTLEWEILGTWS